LIANAIKGYQKMNGDPNYLAEIQRKIR
jgi:hypothetical protein